MAYSASGLFVKFSASIHQQR